jgi:hypothetical protein
MKLIPIKVVSHSGYKADEYPLYFYWHSKKFETKEILDRWYQAERHPSGPAANYFKICTTGNEEYMIKHEVERDRWFLIIPDKPAVRFSAN